MWPFDFSAREALRLPGETSVVWARFDADWYRVRYGGAVAIVGELSDRALLDFYLTFGQGLAHSPNRYFDEAWHRRVYPRIAESVAAGEFSSAFDAYCRTGNADRAPHWLFDELYYRRRYPDLTNDSLQDAELANGYDHFLRHGNREGRLGHPLFDPLYYAANLDAADLAIATDVGPFQHYLQCLDSDRAAAPTTIYFDNAFYLGRYPESSQAHWRSPLEHYLCNDTPTWFDPLEDFSEDWYLASGDGIRRAVETGLFRNGYAHFLEHGARERRAPAPHIDLRWYAEQERVRDSLLAGEATDSFTHWLTIGKTSGYPANPPPEDRIDRGQARSLYRRRAAALVPVHARAPLRYGVTGAPAIAAVMIVRDDLAASLGSLASLRASTRADIELISIVLGDSEIGRFITGGTVQKLDRLVDATAAAAAGLACVGADVVVLLMDGVDIGGGTIEAVSRWFASAPDIAAVGGKILNPEGTLRSAGNIVWRDGDVHRDLEGEPTHVPEANFAHDTHFCGAAFLAFRTKALLALLEAGAAPPIDDAAAADLCLRAIANGQRVVFDPAVMATAWNDADSMATPRIDRDRHAAFLATCQDRDTASPVLARYAAVEQRRVLVIDDTIPLRTLGSGFVRGNDLIRTMASLGYGVTVFPVNGCRFDVASAYAEIPDTVEIVSDHTIERLEEFLRLRLGVYDTVWVSRTHNMHRVRPIFDRVYAHEAPRPDLILDTEAIDSVRQSHLAALEGRAFDIETAVRQEFADSGLCRAIVAVSESEAGMLRAIGWSDVHVIGHQRQTRPTPRPFGDRAGLLFVGAIHRIDSPNYDGLVWFVDEVLPRIEQSLRWETRLTIAGYTAPEVSLDRFLRHPRVTLRGTVPDLLPLYASHRVFVAPTRFAAGAPYKVHEAASFGIPVVGTDLLRAQLGWTDGQEMLSAAANDAERFAERIVALYRDEALWDRIRTNALTRVERDNDPAAYAEALRAVIGPARIDRRSKPS